MKSNLVVVMALLVNGCAPERKAAVEKQTPAAPDAVQSKAKSDAALAKLAPELRAMADDSAKAPGSAPSPAILSAGGKVEVEIVVDTAEAAPQLKGPVEALGGTVVSQFRNHVFASLPIASLKRAAAIAHVTMIQPAKPMQTFPAGRPETPR